MQRGRLLSGLLLLCLLAGLVLPPPLEAQTPEPTPEGAAEEAWLDETLARMTTADKVGQLFLVTFEGGDAGARSAIAGLVQRLRIGGVILSPENGNFSNDATAPDQVLALSGSLQQLAFSASSPITLTQVVPVTVTTPVGEGGTTEATGPITVTTVVTVTNVFTTPPQAIPLFVAVAQEGDGYPYTALRGGFSELPSNMALGATWHTANAEAVGQIVGQELRAVGVNMLLGPSLDVLKTPRPGLPGDLGTRVFGGDPYWVGQMGRAYIQGVHEGSQGRVATVAKHLPGLGASDRSLEQEMATVDKSLQDLRLIELPPFFAVTQAGPVTDTVDALMTAHIRYRGFQGSIRYVTRPISLDPQGMQQIMAQEELLSWRSNGGLLVSDSLGVPAVRRYYSPDLSSFPHRQIALDALQAGNDLLILSRFSLTDSWEDQMRNIEDTVLFFRERYEADDNFRARVDRSVRRMLRLKHRICPDFTLDGCTSGVAALETVGAGGGSRRTITQIAQEAVTLLYPTGDELALRLPRAPRLDEEILIFTDARQVRECALCSPFYLLDPNVLRDTILQMYGPNATGQVDPARIAAYTFADLRDALSGSNVILDRAIGNADWIVFAMLDYAPEAYPSSAALKQFLRERADGLEGKNIIVLAYKSPYYLDTTEVSKLTAYYGIYSRTMPFVEASVRALFLDFGPTGHPPVTVEGVGYDLTARAVARPGPDHRGDLGRPARFGGGHASAAGRTGRGRPVARANQRHPRPERQPGARWHTGVVHFLLSPGTAEPECQGGDRRRCGRNDHHAGAGRRDRDPGHQRSGHQLAAAGGALVGRNDRDSDAHAHADAHVYPYADPHADADTHVDPDTHADAHADAGAPRRCRDRPATAPAPRRVAGFCAGAVGHVCGGRRGLDHRLGGAPARGRRRPVGAGGRCGAASVAWSATCSTGWGCRVSPSWRRCRPDCGAC